MSLRARFAAASAGLALATLGASFVAVWMAYGAVQLRQLDVALEHQARGDAVAASWSRGEQGAPVLQGMDRSRLAPYAAIYDGGGAAIAWTPNLERGRPPLDHVRSASGSPVDLWWSNRHLRAVVVPIAGGGNFSLLLATARTDLDDDERDLARSMAWALFAAVLSSAAAGYWLARLLTKDHDRIAGVARTVAAGNLSARIGLDSGDDEMRQLGRDIDDMIARLALLVETQQRFIANAAHELRSPLTTLLGELSLALRRERTAVEYRTSIEEALSSTRRLKRLAEDLLALARAGATELDQTVVRVDDVAVAALEWSRSAAEDKGVVLEVACDGSKVDGRPGDLERLLRNLVDNAIIHSPPGGTISIEARHEGADEVRVAVTDDGGGVPHEARERIFEPFFRMAEARAEPTGSGLGLTIARSIARSHGGDLWLDTSPGRRGARFVLRLPASLNERPEPVGTVDSVPAMASQARAPSTP